MSDQPATPRDFVPVLHNMVAMGASDLHLKVGAPPTLRIDGQLFGLDEPTCKAGEIAAMIETLLPPEKQMSFAEDLECDVAISIPGLARFRVNLCRQRGSIGVSFRLVPTRIPTLDDLGLPRILGELVQEQRGLILVTGATGAGKSTTMAAMVDHLNHLDTRKIVTVEDPIEYLHKDDRCLIYQREVGDDTHSFQEGLRHVLRQDPDIILIGEIRDKETLSIAITAGEHRAPGDHDAAHHGRGAVDPARASPTTRRTSRTRSGACSRATCAPCSRSAWCRGDGAGTGRGGRDHAHHADDPRLDHRPGEDLEHPPGDPGRRVAVRHAELRPGAGEPRAERDDHAR
jgi:hypothetical protein